MSLPVVRSLMGGKTEFIFESYLYLHSVQTLTKKKLETSVDSYNCEAQYWLFLMLCA